MCDKIPDSIKTKVTVYNAGVLSTLLYGSKWWTTYAAQEIKCLLYALYAEDAWDILDEQMIKHGYAV